MLTGEVIPVMELLASMKSHSVPEDIDVSVMYLLWVPLSGEWVDVWCMCVCVLACWELNPSPQEEQPVLLSTEPSLQNLFHQFL